MENHIVKSRSVNNTESPQKIKLVNEKGSTKQRQRKSDYLIILNCVDVCVNPIFHVISKIQRLTSPTVSATQYLLIFVSTPPSHPASNAIVDLTMRQENATLANVNTVQINMLRTRLNKPYLKLPCKLLSDTAQVHYTFSIRLSRYTNSKSQTESIFSITRTKNVLVNNKPRCTYN